MPTGSQDDKRIQRDAGCLRALKENSQGSRRMPTGSVRSEKPQSSNSQVEPKRLSTSSNPHTDKTRQDRPVRMPTRSEFEHSGPSYSEYSDSSYTSDSTLPLSSLTRPKAVHPDVTLTKRVQVTVLKLTKEQQRGLSRDSLSQGA